LKKVSYSKELCIPKGVVRELLIKVYGGELAGHFDVEKTCLMLKDHCYWPKMAKDVERFVKRCSIWQLVESHVFP